MPSAQNYDGGNAAIDSTSWTGELGESGRDMARRPAMPDVPVVPDEALTIFDRLPDPETQSTVAFAISCFGPVEALMGQGDWLAALLTQCPRTQLGRKLWKYLKYLRRNFANHVPRSPDLSAQTAHFRKRAECYQRAFDETELVVDEVCHAVDIEETALVRETELMTLQIPMCVAIIKAIMDAATEPGEKMGTFTKSTLNILMNVSVWIVRLNLVARDITDDSDLEGRDFEVSLGLRDKMANAMEGFVKRVSGGLNRIAAQERLLARGPSQDSNSPEQHANISSRAASHDGILRKEELSRSPSAPSDARNNLNAPRPSTTAADPSRPVVTFTRVDRRAQMREKRAQRANGSDGVTRKPGSTITSGSTIGVSRSTFSLPPDYKESDPARIVTAATVTSTTATYSVSSPQTHVAGNAQDPRFNSSTPQMQFHVSSTNRLDPDIGR